MDTITKVTLCLEIFSVLGALCLCLYASNMAKHLPGEVERTVNEKLTERLALRDKVEYEKKVWQQMREDEQKKLKGFISGGYSSGYWKAAEKQPEKPKQWVTEIFLPNKDSDKPAYRFHCVSGESAPGVITKGKHYLYTPTGRGFVTTDNPTTAILLQQLLNENQLTVKPFTTNETNQ